jgi:hypothetical protein
MSSDLATSAPTTVAAPDPAIPAGAAPATTPPTRSFLDRAAGWIVGVAAVAAAAVLLHAGRGSSFFWDEWWFIVRRRDASIDDFFRPWNGHLIAIPVLIYKALFELVGLRHYLPYRLVLTAVHVGTCLLLFAYLRRRVTVVYALATTIVILFLGVAWEDLLWPFQITFILSLAGGLAALFLVDRGTRRADVGAALALGASLLSAGLGLLFVGGLILELLWTRRDRRRLWVALAPLAGYGVWYLIDSTPSGSFSRFGYFDTFTTTMVGEAGRALFGTGLGPGQALIIAFYVLAVVQAARTWPVSGRFVNALALPVAYWALVTYGRGGFPVGSRYAHPGAIFLVLAGAEVLRTFGTPRRRPRAVVAVGAVALVLLVAHTLIVNLDALGDGAANLRVFAASDRTRLSALVHVADRADRRGVAFPTVNPLRVGPTLDALVGLGYPVYPPAEMLRQPEHARRTADGTMWAALGGADTAPGILADPGTTLAVDAQRGTVAAAPAAGPCDVITPGGGQARATVTADELRVRVQAGDAPVAVTARSIARGFRPIPTWSIPPSDTVAPGTTRDYVVRATGIRPWHLRLDSTTAFRTCALR